MVIERVGKLGGDGGVITLDKNGNFAMPFDTTGIYRGYTDEDGSPVVLIYRE